MKTWLIPLSLLCAAGIASAEDKTPASAKVEAAKPEAAMATAVAKPADAVSPKPHKAKRLPKGDLRKCLELKDNKAIIACAENRRK